MDSLQFVLSVLYNSQVANAFKRKFQSFKHGDRNKKNNNNVKLLPKEREKTKKNQIKNTSKQESFKVTVNIGGCPPLKPIIIRI